MIYFYTEVEEVENEIATPKISLSESKIEQFDIEGTLIYATNFIGNLSRQWLDLSPELRPRFQKLLFPQGIPYDKEKGFGTAKLGLIYELKRQSISQKSRVVALSGVEPELPA